VNDSARKIFVQKPERSNSHCDQQQGFEELEEADENEQR
jgi:hypothetical protein